MATGRIGTTPVLTTRWSNGLMYSSSISYSLPSTMLAPKGWFLSFIQTTFFITN